MFDSFMMVPLHFTVEFMGFLVFTGACLLTLSRPSLVPGARFNRLSASLGFAALGASLILHGGAFELPGVDPARCCEFDGSELLVALRAMGLAFVLVGVGGGIRVAAPSVAVAFQIRESLLLAPAGAALLLALVSFIAASTPGRKLARRLGLAALLLAGAEVLTAVVPDERFGQGQIDGYALGAHGLKLLAFVALSSWLWAGVRSSIRTRFVASFVALLIAVVLALSSALTGIISSNVESEELKRVSAQLTNVMQNIQREDVSDLKNTASTLAESFGSANIDFLSRSDEQIRATIEQLLITDPVLEDIADFMIVLSPRGTLRAYAGHGPITEGDRTPKDLKTLEVLAIIGSDAIQRDILREGTPEAVAIDQIDRDSVAIMAALRIESEVTRRTVGILALGGFLDAQTVDLIRSQVKPAFPTLIVGKRVIASSLPGDFDYGDLLSREIQAELGIPQAGPLTTQLTLRSRTFYSAFDALETPTGDPVATLGLSAPSGIVSQSRAEVTRTLFLVAMAVAAIALVLAWLSGRRITRPIQVLTDAARAVREGDLKVQAAVAGEDEVGQLGETFNEMTGSLLRMTSDLREAAREEHELRAQIEAIIQSMADGLVAVDADLRILAFNSQAERLTGVKSRQALNKPIQTILDARDSHGEPVPLPIYGLAPGSVGGVMLQRRKGDPIPVAVLCAVLRDEEGEVSGGVAVLRDMTREREIERMKSEFLSNISHELRTPLTPIKGYAEIMGRKDLPPDKSRKFAKGILESTMRLERIVELLVDFAAMEAGRLAPKSTPIDIKSMIEQLASEWKERTPNHEVVAEVRARLPKVSGDERLIRRSLEELLDNAVKFSPSGGTIRLEAKGGISPNGQDRRRQAVYITVSDEGIGIPKDDVAKIFSDFQQLDGSETRTYGGLGLGLAFVQRIVEAHDGSVEVESEPNQGTRLTISFPASRSRRRPGR